MSEELNATELLCILLKTMNTNNHNEMEGMCTGIPSLLPVTHFYNYPFDYEFITIYFKMQGLDN